MKKLIAIAALVCSSFLFASSSAAAADKVKCTITKVDGASRKITVRKEKADKDEELAVDASVNLDKVKANSKAQLTVDGGVVKTIEAEAKPRAAGY